MRYMLPPLIFLIWALWSKFKLRDLRDPALRKGERRVLWAFWQLADRSLWTEEGLRVRSAWFRHMFIGTLLAVGCIVLLQALPE